MVADRQKPIDLSLVHDPTTMRYLGARPFDVGVSHPSGTYGTFYVKREGWRAFTREVAEDRAHENGALETVRSDGRVRLLFGGEEVPTPWCLRTLAHHEAIYLTDEE
ncbi:hypothetical protein ACWDYK_08145 [Streptomyces anthocyanicus]|uniref:hypothetical protein n=1 Tax=Streptomyces anthocyanicus TaxID=68174 RepID=UPI002F91060B